MPQNDTNASVIIKQTMKPEITELEEKEHSCWMAYQAAKTQSEQVYTNHVHMMRGLWERALGDLNTARSLRIIAHAMQPAEGQVGK